MKQISKFWKLQLCPKSIPININRTQNFHFGVILLFTPCEGRLRNKMVQNIAKPLKSGHILLVLSQEHIAPLVLYCEKRYFSTKNRQ